MDIAILLFDRFESLDAVGPFEVLRNIPGANVTFVAREAGPVRNSSGALAIVADKAIAEVTSADILVVPGGFGQAALMDDEEILGWIRAIDATTTWTTSVCTGSLLLAQAGVLDGLAATTHWEDVAALRALRPGLQVRDDVRWVDAGAIVTSAGISAGIDMSLHLVERLHSRELAVRTARQMEFDWTPAS